MSASKPDEEPEGAPELSRPPSPKRGAFPTPKEEIERANPYIPNADEANECAGVPPGPPTQANEK